MVLAVKWIYRFTNNKKGLWHKVVFSQSNGKLNSLLPSLGNKGNKSVLLGFVNEAIGISGRARDIFDKNFKSLIRDGCDTNFWNDD